jgi:signal transduction histidine kinase
MESGSGSGLAGTSTERTVRRGRRIGHSADAATVGASVASPDVEANRGSRSLAALLRLGVAAVVFAAYVVDWWVSGTFYEADVGAAMLVIGSIMLCGWAWSLWPRSTLFVGTVASLASLALTANLDGRLRFPFFTEFALLPVLLGATLWRKTPWRWPVAVLVFAAGEAVALRAHNDGIRNILAVTMLVLCGGAVTVVVYAWTKDNERRTGIELARRTERLELARELHDIVGHHVTGIVVLAQASRFAAASGSPAATPLDTDRTLADIERAGLETLTSVRRLVGLLRDDAPTTAGPQLPDIEQLVADLRATHPQATLDADSAIRMTWVPADLATTVHRLVQEATTNVRKHGDPDGPVTVSLRRTSLAIEVEVQNLRLPGVVASGYGLVGMRERVQALGGSFAAGPAGERVWIVHVALPLAGAA